MEMNTDKQSKYRENDKDIVFGINWFRKHQSALLWLLNSPLTKRVFRFLLGIYPEAIPLKENIVEILPNNFAFNLRESVSIFSKEYRKSHKGIDAEKVYKQNIKELIEKETYFVSLIDRDFRAHDQFAKKLYHRFKYVWWTMHAFDWALLDRVEALSKASFGFSTLTVNSDSGHRSGYIRRNGVNQTLANIRAGTGTTAFYGPGDSNFTCQLETDVSVSVNNWYSLYRGIVMYDTSSLTTDANISAVVESLWGGASNDFLGTAPECHISQGASAALTSLSNSDYDQVNHGTTSFGNVAFASVASSAYTDITLNASGIASISKTATTKHSIQTQWDIENNFGGTYNGNNKKVFFNWQTYDAAHPPKLVVTYTVGSVFPRIGLLGVGRG